jgi:hypothetical protein
MLQVFKLGKVDAEEALFPTFPPRQSVGGGKFIQKRRYPRSPLLKTTALKGKLTFGDPFLDSGVAVPVKVKPSSTGVQVEASLLTETLYDVIHVSQSEDYPCPFS